MCILMYLLHISITNSGLVCVVVAVCISPLTETASALLVMNEQFT